MLDKVVASCVWRLTSKWCEPHAATCVVRNTQHLGARPTGATIAPPLRPHPANARIDFVENQVGTRAAWLAMTDNAKDNRASSPPE